MYELFFTLHRSSEDDIKWISAGIWERNNPGTLSAELQAGMGHGVLCNQQSLDLF